MIYIIFMFYCFDYWSKQNNIFCINHYNREVIKKCIGPRNHEETGDYIYLFLKMMANNNKVNVILKFKTN